MVRVKIGKRERRVVAEGFERWLNGLLLPGFGEVDDQC